MVQIQLTKMFLTNVVSIETLAAQTDPARSQTYSVAGDVRTYAGGRQRGVGSVGLSGSWKFVLVELTLTQIGVMRAWMTAGVTVLARDHRGQSMYGTFFQVDVGENMGMGTAATYTASIELKSVSVVEGV
jgi:hypothetical protein